MIIHVYGLHLVKQMMSVFQELIVIVALVVLLSFQQVVQLVNVVIEVMEEAILVNV
jgi:hypothetical protein